MSQVNWINMDTELPPIGKYVLTLHVGVKQMLGMYSEPFVSGDKMEVLSLDENGHFYPGGLARGWISHWSHLPEKPDDFKIMDLTK